MKISDIILILATIGGGFTGFVVTFGLYVSSQNVTGAQYFIFGVVLSLYAYIVYAGLRFTHNRSDIKHLKNAFLLQLPWISSPLIYFKLTAGISLSAILSINSLDWQWNLGSQFQFNILSGNSWAIGLNAGAIFLYWLAFRAGQRIDDALEEPITESPSFGTIFSAENETVSENETATRAESSIQPLEAESDLDAKWQSKT